MTKVSSRRNRIGIDAPARRGSPRQLVLGLLAELAVASLCACGESNVQPTGRTPTAVAPEKDAVAEVIQSAEELTRGAANGDVRTLDSAISDKCEAKSEVLAGAAIFASVLAGPDEIEFPPEAFVVEFLDDDLAIVKAGPNADSILINGTPVNPDVADEITFTHEVDGTWRMLNCEIIDYQID